MGFFVLQVGEMTLIQETIKVALLLETAFIIMLESVLWEQEQNLVFIARKGNKWKDSINFTLIP